MRGWLALGGGDEFGPRCERGDRALLAAVGGQPQIAIVPTAQADGGSDPLRAGNNGVRYFERLGAPATNVLITDRTTANDPHMVAQLSGADLIYLIGGNPGYLLTTLRDTAALQTIHSAWQRGATICGSSAGAMVLCAAQIGRFSGSREPWIPAFGFVPRTLVAVHQERAPDAAGLELRHTLPADYRVISIHAGDLAVWRPDGGWQMFGEGTVRVFHTPDAPPDRYSHGDMWTMDS